MPAPKKGWLTPDSPASEEIECRAILIPSNLEFIGAVNGALLELTKAYNWEQFGTMTPAEAAAIMYDAWLVYVESVCAGKFAKGWRVNYDGRVQYTENNAETWTAADEDVWLPTEARTEPTPEERRCLAAANAVAVLRQTYVEMLIVFNTDKETLYGAAALGAIMGLLFLGLLVPVEGIAVVNILIAFTIEGFAGGYAALEFLSDDDWTPEYDDFFKCLLYENSVDAAGVVSFDWGAVRANIYNPTVDLGISIWNFYILSIVGQEGLNNAGTTTSIEEADCEDCEQCDVSLGGFGLNDWIPELAPGGSCTTGDLDYDAGLDRVIRTGACTAGGGAGGYVVVSMRKTFDFVIESMSVNYDLSNSSCDSGATFMRVLDAAGTLVAVSSSGAVTGGLGNTVDFPFAIPLPAGEYYVAFECGNGTSSVPGGAYASINQITVCGTAG